MRTASVVATFIAGTVFASFVAYAWTGPTQPPPNGNVAAPINVGVVDQVKNAGIGMNSLAVFGNAILSGASRYINFGTTAGTGGYGFRDNSGILEYKNSTGSWRSFSGGDGVGPVSQITFTDGTTQTTAPGGGTTVQYQPGMWCGARKATCSSAGAAQYMSPNIACNGSSLSVSCGGCTTDDSGSRCRITSVNGCPSGYSPIEALAYSYTDFVPLAFWAISCVKN